MRKPLYKTSVILLLLCTCGIDPIPDRDATADQAVWSYDSLSAAERAVIDHDRVESASWSAIANGFASAVRETAARSGR